MILLQISSAFLILVTKTNGRSKILLAKRIVKFYQSIYVSVCAMLHYVPASAPGTSARLLVTLFCCILVSILIIYRVQYESLFAILNHLILIPGVKLNLTTETSNAAICPIVQWPKWSDILPVPFFSLKLKSGQKRYSTYHRDLLVYRSIRHSWHFLKSRGLCINTDHKPLFRLFNTKPDICLSTRIRCVDTVVADAFSHTDTSILHLQLDVPQWTGVRQTGSFFLDFRSLLDLLDWPSPGSHGTNLCHWSTGNFTLLFQSIIVKLFSTISIQLPISMFAPRASSFCLAQYELWIWLTNHSIFPLVMK